MKIGLRKRQREENSCSIVVTCIFFKQILYIFFILRLFYLIILFRLTFIFIYTFHSILKRKE